MDKPTLNKRGELLFADGSQFFPPLISTVEVNSPPRDKDWIEFQSRVVHKCHPRCKHALKPRCKEITISISQVCGCGGRGHSEAIRAKYHTLDEYDGEGDNSKPSPIPIGVYD